LYNAFLNQYVEEN